MSKVINLGKGRMSPENLAHEIPWKELKQTYIIAERLDGKIMVGSTELDAKTAALFKMLSEEVLLSLASAATLSSETPCKNPNCKTCKPSTPRDPSDEEEDGNWDL